MPEASEDEIRTPAQARKASIHLSADSAETLRDRMAERLLDVAVTPFLGVHIRCIGREPFHRHRGMCGDIFLHSHRPMGRPSIPDNDHRSSHVSRPMVPHHQDILRPEGVLNMARVHLAGARESDDGREFAAFTDSPQGGRLADRSPRRGHLGAEGKPCFVDEHYFSPRAAGLFFIRRQSRVSQACTSASSRSRA